MVGRGSKQEKFEHIILVVLIHASFVVDEEVQIASTYLFSFHPLSDHGDN
jgi:hypothetical protein